MFENCVFEKKPLTFCEINYPKVIRPHTDIQMEYIIENIGINAESEYLRRLSNCEYYRLIELLTSKFPVYKQFLKQYINCVAGYLKEKLKRVHQYLNSF